MNARTEAGLRVRTAGGVALLGALAVAAAWLARPGDVEAHAELLSADPPPGAALASAPARVTLRFSEPVDRGFTEVEVVDSSGVSVAVGETEFGAAGEASRALAPLEDGLYTVVWRNVSALDGHGVRGQFSFTVGEAAAGVVPPASGSESATSSFGALARWLATLPVLAAFGLSVFALAGPVESARARLLAVAGGLLLVAAPLAALHLVAHASQAGDAVPDAVVRTLREGRWGALWLARVALLLVASGLAGAAARGSRRGAAGVPVVLALALATSSASSHAAASEPAVAAMLADFGHRVAAGTWLGALAAVLLCWRTTEDHARLVGRFTLLATVAVAALLAFGLAGVVAEAGSREALATPYGRLLLAKVAGTALVLFLAAVNRWMLAPRLPKHEAATAWLPRLAVVEVVAIAGLAGVGAVLASTEPGWQAREVEQALAPPPQVVDRLEIAPVLRPGATGVNDLEIELEQGGGPVSGARVRTVLTGPGLAPEDYLAHDFGDGLYHAGNPELSVAGAWTLVVEVQRPNAFDARATFPLEVGTAPPIASPPQPSARRVAAVALLAAAITALAGAWAWRGFVRSRRAPARAGVSGGAIE